MISRANVTIQFGEKPLFEDVSVKFGNGHRYGLIGANGSGQDHVHEGARRRARADARQRRRSQAHARVGKLRQDQFAFEEFSGASTP